MVRARVCLSEPERGKVVHDYGSKMPELSRTFFFPSPRDIFGYDPFVSGRYYVVGTRWSGIFPLENNENITRNRCRLRSSCGCQAVPLGHRIDVAFLAACSPHSGMAISLLCLRGVLRIAHSTLCHCRITPFSKGHRWTIFLTGGIAHFDNIYIYFG